MRIIESLYTMDENGYLSFTGKEISLNSYGPLGYTTLDRISKDSDLFQKEVLNIFTTGEYGFIILIVCIRTIVNDKS